MAPRVIEIDAAATHDLRRRVLRVGTTSTDVVFPDDDAADTTHLAVDLDGRIVAISTWIHRRQSADTGPADTGPAHTGPADTGPTAPGPIGRQLRGMATDPAVRGLGYGALLLRTGLRRAGDEGVDVVWANARTEAVGFYLAHGFDVEGPQYVDAVTGLPHQRIVCPIGSVPASAVPTVG